MKWDIRPISKEIAEKVVSAKHYTRKPSIFWCAFGLYRNQELQGVVVYGQPSPPIQRSAFEGRDFRLYELSRLVIESDDKNAASRLVGGSLAMLEPKPCAVISYADSEHGHCGIVYQATNWIYTGATVSHDKLYIIDGERVHPMTLRDRGITDPMRWAKENGIQSVSPSKKHRYFFFVGSRTQKKAMARKLKYPIVNEYPKSDKTRYDDGPNISSVFDCADGQFDLFGIQT